jgi:hypothetical protein
MMMLGLQFVEQLVDLECHAEAEIFIEGFGYPTLLRHYHSSGAIIVSWKTGRGLGLAKRALSMGNRSGRRRGDIPGRDDPLLWLNVLNRAHTACRGGGCR